MKKKRKKERNHVRSFLFFNVSNQQNSNCLREKKEKNGCTIVNTLQLKHCYKVLETFSLLTWIISLLEGEIFLNLAVYKGPVGFVQK